MLGHDARIPPIRVTMMMIMNKEANIKNDFYHNARTVYCGGGYAGKTNDVCSAPTFWSTTDFLVLFCLEGMRCNIRRFCLLP